MIKNYYKRKTKQFYENALLGKINIHKQEYLSQQEKLKDQKKKEFMKLF